MLKCSRIEGIWFVSFNEYAVGIGFTCSQAVKSMIAKAEHIELAGVVDTDGQVRYTPCVW